MQAINVCIESVQSIRQLKIRYFKDFLLVICITIWKYLIKKYKFIHPIQI